MSALQSCGTTRGWISLVNAMLRLVWVALLWSVTVAAPLSPVVVSVRGLVVALRSTLLVKESPSAVGSPASDPPV